MTAQIMTKKKQPDTGMDRLKKVALWQWGLITIFAAIFANQFLSTFFEITGSSAGARGQAFGRGIATVGGVIVGIMLIVVDVVRRRRR